jgi:hypothetical protein
MISKFMNDPKKSHMTAAKRILRYVKGSIKFGLLFPTSIKDDSAKLVSYSYFDRGGDKVDRRSTSSYAVKYNVVIFFVYQETTRDCIIHL